MPHVPFRVSRRALLLAGIAFLAVSLLLTLSFLAALVRRLQDASGLPAWLVLLPLLGVLLLLAEFFALFYLWDALRGPGAAGAGMDAAAGWPQRALRPPRDVTDLPIQSAGGIVLHLEYTGLPAILLASILDEISYTHKEAAHRIAGSVVTSLLDAAALAPDKAQRLTTRLVEDQIVSLDTISSRRSVTVLIAVGFVVLVGGGASPGKLIYEQLVKQVADELQAVMSAEVVNAVRRAVHRFGSRSSERILNRTNLRITVQPWREVKTRRQDRVISEAVLESERPAVPVWPAEGYEVEQPRTQRNQMYRRTGAEGEHRLSPPAE